MLLKMDDSFMLRFCQALAIFGTLVLADTRLVIAGDFENKQFVGASGSCTSTGIFVTVNTTHMLFNPDSLLLRAIGHENEILDTINYEMQTAKVEACQPKINPETKMATFNFTFADCPTIPFQENNSSSVIYAYRIESVINNRDVNKDDQNSVFRENREFLSIRCEVDARAVSIQDFVADVASTKGEIENVTSLRIATRLFRDSSLDTHLAEPMPLSEWIYATVGFEGPEPSLYLTPQDCRAELADFGAVHYLFKAGCPVDPKTQILSHETTQSEFKHYVFRFQSFAFVQHRGLPIRLTCTAESFKTRQDAADALKKCEEKAYFDSTDGTSKAKQASVNKRSDERMSTISAANMVSVIKSQ